MLCRRRIVEDASMFCVSAAIRSSNSVRIPWNVSRETFCGRLGEFSFRGLPRSGAASVFQGVFAGSAIFRVFGLAFWQRPLGSPFPGGLRGRGIPAARLQRAFTLPRRFGFASEMPPVSRMQNVSRETFLRAFGRLPRIEETLGLGDARDSKEFGVPITLLPLQHSVLLCAAGRFLLLLQCLIVLAASVPFVPRDVFGVPCGARFPRQHSAFLHSNALAPYMLNVSRETFSQTEFQSASSAFSPTKRAMNATLLPPSEYHDEIIVSMSVQLPSPSSQAVRASVAGA